MQFKTLINKKTGNYVYIDDYGLLWRAVVPKLLPNDEDIRTQVAPNVDLSKYELITVHVLTEEEFEDLYKKNP